MKRISLILSILFLATSAVAHDNGNPNGNHPHPGGDSASDAAATATAGSGDVNTTTTYRGTEEVGRPAAVYGDACTTGVSASGMGGGATFSAGNRFCLWLSLSNAAYAQGDTDEALRFRKVAEQTLQRQQNPVVRVLEYIPLVGRFF